MLLFSHSAQAVQSTFISRRSAISDVVAEQKVWKVCFKIQELSLLWDFSPLLWWEGG